MVLGKLKFTCVYNYIYIYIYIYFINNSHLYELLLIPFFTLNIICYISFSIFFIYAYLYCTAHGSDINNIMVGVDHATLPFDPHIKGTTHHATSLL